MKNKAMILKCSVCIFAEKVTKELEVIKLAFSDFL